MLFHDAPVFRLTRVELLRRFCTKYGIAEEGTIGERITAVASAFSSVPYENLTKIIKTDGVVGPQSAMRYPDEVIGDHLRWGTGGTCFSLTAAIIAVYDALGIEAHPLLADRHYGTDTHCGLVVKNGDALLLLDPGYLLFTPVPLPVAVTAVVPQGYTTIELCPHDDGRHIDLATVVRGSRKVRLVYKRSIVDPETFMKAWVSSFAWEMMTYPVVTRCTAGEHLYVQGAKVSVRSAEKTERFTMEQSEEIRMLQSTIGIAPEITKKAWGIVHGGN